MERIEILQQHFKSLLEQNNVSGKADHSLAGENLNRPLIDVVENRILRPERIRLIDQFPSPFKSTSLEHIKEAIIYYEKADAYGERSVEYLKFSEKIGHGKNFVVPRFFQPKGTLPVLDLLLVVADPDDMQKIAKNHIKKSIMYSSPFLGEAVLSTKDNEMWQDQRRHLASAFLPHTMLGSIFNISRDRAKFSVLERLPTLMNASNEIEIGEFLLYEAMAQLQLALLGESKEYMEESNKPIRDSFKFPFWNTEERIKIRDADPSYKPFISRPTKELVGELHKAKDHHKAMREYANEIIDRAKTGVTCPGPLMERVLDICPMGKQRPDIQRDLGTTILFAGHDTTANLMTHFMYAMATYPEWQTKIQAEIDSVFKKLDAENRELQYTDLLDMNNIKRCINEVLRLWPSVPNGTFREFQYADTISCQKDGGIEQVEVPAGIQCILAPLILHRNPELWGKDVDEFNPDRDWTDDEDWHGVGLKGINPESRRYCPFTISPRDCLGRNFAQMEARVILIFLLREYSVILAPASEGKSLQEISKNYGTFGPEKGLYVTLQKRAHS